MRARRLDSCSKAGGSLCDVQQLAGHRSIEQTQTCIDAKRPWKATPSRCRSTGTIKLPQAVI
jgi:hypothetical protein